MQQRFLLQILLLAQHVSDITMPIIRGSRCSWWWAWWCLKHVKQTIRSAIKTSVHLVGILFPLINDDARSKSHQKRNIILIINGKNNISIGLSCVGTALKNVILKENFNFGEDEINDVSRDWMTVKKYDDTANCKRNTLSLLMEYFPWKGLWTCRKSDYGMNVWIIE